MVHVLDVLARTLTILVQAVTLVTILAKLKGVFHSKRHRVK